MLDKWFSIEVSEEMSLSFLHLIIYEVNTVLSVLCPANHNGFLCHIVLELCDRPQYHITENVPLSALLDMLSRYMHTFVLGLTIMTYF